MDTNYFLELPGAPAAEDEGLHIGKKSAGWQFGFRGYRASVPEDCGMDIRSAAGWRDLMSANPDARIVDEYGDEISRDQFWQMVESSKGGYTHASYTAEHGAGRYDHLFASSLWVDAEGFDFMGLHFS